VTTERATGRVEYDEFSYFHENAEEFGLPYDGPPTVRRETVPLGDGRSLSALVWGSAPPELVLIHGGAQNAHTWDTVALALGRPLLAVDLPGHGHSDGPKEGRSTDPLSNAEDVAVAIDALAPSARGVVGMSLGGMTTIALAAARPDLVARYILVDVTPGVTGNKAEQIIAFVNGPESFPSFDEILARTVQFNPTRTESSLRRGILHNAEQLEDGSWVWRHARHRVMRPGSAEQPAPAPDPDAPRRDFGVLWDAISGYPGPIMLARGMRSGSVVDDADEAELVKRRPDARIEHVAEAGHSIQGDDPLTLTRLIEDFIP
jgi:pimeloyl-ACP methyl ester carboxylesterase